MSLSDLQAAIDAAGAKVRELKTAKGEKSAVDEAVAGLLAAKKAFTDAGGVLPDPPQQQKKKKKKGSEEPAPAAAPKKVEAKQAPVPKKEKPAPAAGAAAASKPVAVTQSVEGYFAEHDIAGVLDQLVKQLATECPKDPKAWMGAQLNGFTVAPCEPKWHEQAVVHENGHPAWHNPSAQPAHEKPPQLMVFNSLTDTKRPFVPKRGNTVTWYTCGPTVYDLCHLGHARAYLTFDIIRRIMEDYFHYDVQYIMNITDIDDKIILRGRQNKLMADYHASFPGFDAVKADVHEAMKKFRSKLATELQELAQGTQELEAEIKAEGGNAQKQKELDGKKEKFEEQKFKVKQGETMQAKVDAAAKAGDAKLMVQEAHDPLAKLLDSRHGADVTDNDIFRAHAAKYEALFMKDMDDLGIRQPDVLTRVTEYVPEIEAFIQKIIDNGFAYESNKSVYFNTKAYIKAGHDYPKLRPGGSSDLLAEGEGSLSTDGSEKKNDTDFALWKASKRGEPSWKSRWGMGRPGWHIECSVMAGEILGEQMDIHAGGDDLKFPHHDNELAQSEAHFGCCQWVNYFVHAGRLNIDGLKMSKSLKNFTTIQEVLKQFSPRQMRIMFLRQAWDQTMMYNFDAMDAAQTKERDYKIFLGNALAAVREQGVTCEQAWNADDKEAAAKLAEYRAAFHAGLCDNFSTPKAMAALENIKDCFNKYMELPAAKALLIRKAADYVSRMLRMFGVFEDSDFLAFGVESHIQREAGPYLDALAALRDQVRAAAQKKQNMAHQTALVAGAVPASAAPFADCLAQFNTTVAKIPQGEHHALLVECDRLRDEVLPALGVMLEDRTGRAARWRMDSPEDLLRDIAESKAKAADKAAGSKKEDPKKIEKRLQQSRKLLEGELALVTPVTDFYKVGEHAAKYKAWDEEGYPTETAAGDAVDAKQKKKLVKPFENNAKKVAKQEEKGGAKYVDELRAKIKSDEELLASQ